MEIAGLIKDTPVETLVEQAETEEQTGILFLKSDQGIGEILFENGEIYAADSPFVQERIGQKLVVEGTIQAADIYQALREQENGEHRLLGEILLQKKLLPSDRVKRVVKQQIQESVLHLLMWNHGQFTFERTSPKRPHLVTLRPAALLKEKTKRLKEVRSYSGRRVLEKIEDHPNPRIHQGLRQEIRHTISRPKIFEPRIVVLLVEGDAKWRIMVQDELAKQNFHVKGVSSPEKAQFEIERMLEQRYSPIVIADIDFPRQERSMTLEGLAFMEKLHLEHPGIPMLVSTSYPISNLRRKILFLGGTFCLVKPDLSILSSKNFEQIFQSFIRELTYCLDISIHQYYQDYSQERAEIIKNDLIKDLYSTKTEVVHLGDQVIEDAKIREAFFRISDMLVRKGDMDGAIEAVLDFLVGRCDHICLFLWGKKYLNGYLGRSTLRADFSDTIQGLSVAYAKVPFLKKIHAEQTIFSGSLPGEPAYTRFLDRFLERRPSWHLLYPVVVMGKVVALWYADKEIQKGKAPNTEALVSLFNLIVLSLKMDIEKNGSSE